MQPPHLAFRQPEVLPEALESRRSGDPASRGRGRPSTTIHFGDGDESNRTAKATLAAMMESPMMGVNT
ncbi:MAG: hypothetical protein LN413_05090, partial [Candidatus Thermoplasmatota archaeon]|nr:hypothetical protein [Candidatus Thermoplasmatota archaeon]